MTQPQRTLATTAISGRLATELRYRHSLQLEAVIETARQMSRSLNLRTVYETALRRLHEIVPFDEGLVLVPGESSDELLAAFRYFGVMGEADERGWKTSAPALLNLFEEPRSLHVPEVDSLNDPADLLLAASGFASLLALPAGGVGSPALLLVLARRKTRAFSGEEIDIAERIAVQLGVAADNAQTHAQLQRAFQELRDLQAASGKRERIHTLGLMAGGIARDINSALMPVLGFSEMLLEETGPADPKHWRRYVSLIRRGAREATASVQRLTAFHSRSGEGMEPAAIDLNALIRNAVEMTRPRWESMARGDGQEIRLRMNLGVLPLLRGDVNVLLDALLALILHSVSTLSHPGGELSFRTLAAGGQIHLELGRTGFGATHAQTADEASDRDALRQALTATYDAVARFGGSLDWEKSEEQGLLFLLSLPLPQNSAAPDDAEKKATGSVPAAGSAPTDSATSDPPQAEQRCMRVLVVDDEPMVREMVSTALRSFGHIVLSVADGEEALALFKPGFYDLVITDRSMPKLNGDRLAVLLKAQDPGQTVFLLTGFGDMMNAAGERPVGVDSILGKPLSLRTLREALGRVPLRALRVSAAAESAE